MNSCSPVAALHILWYTWYPCMKLLNATELVFEWEIAAILHMTIIPKRHPNICANSVFANFLALMWAPRFSWIILALYLRHLQYMHSKYNWTLTFTFPFSEIANIIYILRIRTDSRITTTPCELTVRTVWYWVFNNDKVSYFMTIDTVLAFWIELNWIELLLSKLKGLYRRLK